MSGPALCEYHWLLSGEAGMRHEETIKRVSLMGVCRSVIDTHIYRVKIQIGQ